MDFGNQIIENAMVPYVPHLVEQLHIKERKQASVQHLFRTRIYIPGKGFLPYILFLQDFTRAFKLCDIILYNVLNLSLVTNYIK